MEHKIHKLKSLTMSSIMKNPDLYQKLKDGLNSELGSSKRAEALSILRTTKKINQNRFMGQGGGPLPFSINQSGGVNQLPEDTSGRDYGTLTTSSDPYSIWKEAPFKPASTQPVTPTPTPQSNQQQQQQQSQPQQQQQQQQQQTPTGKTPVPDPFDPNAVKSTVMSGLEGLLTSYPTDFNTYYSSLSPENQERLKGFKQDVDNNIGGDLFAYKTLNSKEEFNKLFPGVPDSERPTGAILLNQLNELKKTLADEFNLTEQENKLLDLQKNGANLQNDLKYYIESKDQNIKDIDALIEKARTGTMSANLADPHNKTMYDTYMNYLQTLKGRQQQRYNDYIDRSINEYDSELNRLNSKLTLDKNNFINEYNTRAGILTTDYENKYKAFSTSLMSMYDDAVNMQAKEAEKWNMQAEKYNNMYSILDNVIKLNGEGSNADSDLVRNATDYDKLFKSYTEQIPYPNDPNKKLDMVKGDINQLMDAAQNELLSESSGERLRADSVLKIINDKIINNVDTAYDQGLLDQFWNNYSPMIKNYYNYRGAQSPADTTMAFQLASNLIDSLGGKVYEDLGSDSKLGTYKEAISDLLGLGGNFFKRNKEKITDNNEKIKWINTYKAKGIDPLLLEAIHNQAYRTLKTTANKPDQLFSETERTSRDGIANIIKNGLWKINNMEDIGYAYKSLTQ